MSIKYEPSSELLHVSAKWLFLNREVYTLPEYSTLAKTVPNCHGRWTQGVTKFD